MIALSTCWQSNVAQSGRDLIENLKSLGFNEVELAYGITPAMLAELRPALETSNVRPVSLHNCFPAPDVASLPSGDIWSFSSEDPEERHTAVIFTKRAIEIAGELGAKALILHCGHVIVNPYTNELREIYDAGQIEAPSGNRLLGTIKAARASKIGGALDRVRRCLEPLVEIAQKKDVKLGLENRYQAHEIPNSEDLDFLLSSFDNKHVGYWHNVGHAAVQENLGLDSQTVLLGRYRARTIGVHLHDINGYRDHLAPGDGEVDFTFIKDNLPNNIIKVLEIQPAVTVEQMRAGIGHLTKVGIA